MREKSNCKQAKTYTLTVQATYSSNYNYQWKTEETESVITGVSGDWVNFS